MSERGARDWQINKSVLECNKYMLESGFAADVHFLVHSPDGATETIRAHKYVLVSRSPVFEAQFHGGVTDLDQSNQCKIEITDAQPAAFKEFLKFVYYETVDLKPDSVLPVLYLAKKYLLDSLVDRCVSFLEQTLSAETVCTTLDHALMYDEKELAARCVRYIAAECGRVLASPSFLDLSPEALWEVLRCDLLYVESESDVIDACVRWARARVGRSQPTDAEIREQLADVIGQIRFLSMSPEQFALTVGRSGLLVDGEKAALYYYLLTGDRRHCVTDLGFNPVSRIQKCLRYTGMGDDATWWSCNGPNDAVSFAVDRPIVLVGLSVYGGRRPARHQVTVEVWQNSPQTLLGKVNSCLLSDGREEPFPIYLADGDRLELAAGREYTALVNMKGPLTYYGADGRTECIGGMGVRFTFSASDMSGNGTNTKSGQIPELLFLLK